MAHPRAKALSMAEKPVNTGHVKHETENGLELAIIPYHIACVGKGDISGELVALPHVLSV